MSPLESIRVYFTGFPTLLADGLVTEDGLPSEGVKEEILAYDKYHTERGRKIRDRKAGRPEGHDPFL